MANKIGRKFEVTQTSRRIQALKISNSYIKLNNEKIIQTRQNACLKQKKV